ncbi:Methyl-accepting chemotaxis protein I (serine chemoreceptor protein) [hydrothermal vent metagenome]|uniref:Methyl-accepting chemotaxis protein I (Serine chemoreceptor protein) n=1 Tax=hydrothermal vent metagenome TaxID=652676 RepID=A0A3B0VUV0_9ZZZZ
MATHFIRNLSVRWRLLGFVFCLLLFIVVSGTGGLLGMRATKQSLSTVYNNHVKPMEELRKINDLFKFSVTDTAERVLYQQITSKQAAAKVARAKTLLEKNVASLLAGSENSGQRDNTWLLTARPLIIKAKALTGDLLTVLQQNDVNKLDSLFADRLKPFQKNFEKTINSLIVGRINGVKNEYERAEKRFVISQAAFAATILIGVIISLIAGFFLMRSIDEPLVRMQKALDIMMHGDLTQKLDYDAQNEFGVLIDGFNRMAGYLEELIAQIQRAGIQVTSSITEIAASSRQQEATANEHAATASEIAASTNQIAATSANLMTTMKRVNSLTKNAAFAAEDGHAGLEHIDRTMVRMEEATGAIVDKLSVLSEKAGDIAGVVKTINKLADQTNLLSLNAAIEAEKAGEYGSGFSVVAMEIRRLADQTAVATYDIEQMVQGVQSAVSSAVMGIDKFAKDVHVSVTNIRDGSERLQGVIEQVEVLRPQVKVISEGIEAQSQGARQISDATNQLNSAAQQSAESIGQMNITIERLQQAAQSLQKAISRFKVA